MIIIYGRPGCGACENVKALLTRRGIEFTYENINDSIIEDAIMCGINTLPVIKKDGKYVSAQEVLA